MIKNIVRINRINFYWSRRRRNKYVLDAIEHDRRKIGARLVPCHIVEITSPTSQSTMVIARNRYTSVHVFLVIVIHLRYVSVRYYVSYSLLQPSRTSPAPATISNNSRSYSLGYPLILNVRQRWRLTRMEIPTTSEPSNYAGLC